MNQAADAARSGRDGGAALSRADRAEQFKVRRSPKQLLELSDYLRTGGGGARINSPQLCQVMEVAVGGKGSEDPGWRGFPWLTLLLGSGCLELPYAVDQRADEISEAAGNEVAGLLGNVIEPGAAGPIEERVTSFIQALVKDRSHPVAEEGTDDDESPAIELHPAAARLAIASQALTHVFFLANANGVQPLSHWDDDKVEVDLSNNEMMTKIRLAIDQLRAVKQALPSGGEHYDINDALQDIIDRVLGQLQRWPSMLHLIHLRLLTDLTWYLLNLGTNAYPGWADLLLGVMLREAGDDAEMARGLPRLTTQRRIPSLVKGLFLPPTTASWGSVGVLPGEEPVEPTPGPVQRRNEFYAETARTLWAQDALVQPGTGPSDLEVDWGETQFPAVSAFVSSFDLELEMALWATAPIGEDGHTARPYFIVMPVHVVYSSGDTDEQATASHCWLRAKVQPDRDPSLPIAKRLKQITEPDSWQVVGWSKEGDSLSDGVVYDARSFHAGPHVVHLSGCPIIRLPGQPADGQAGIETLPDDLVVALEELGIHVPAGDRSSPVEHAVIVDEYLAFTQSETELRRSVSERRVPRLHPFLLNSSMSPDRPGRNPRYWLAMGVPVTDGAVRHRILSQLVSGEGQLVHPASQGAPGPTLAGDDAPPPSTQLAWGAPPSPAQPDDGGLDMVPDEAGLRTDRRIAGAVVNRRITEDEAGIFYWLGLDVVRADSLRHTDHIRHYRAHIEAHISPTRDELAEWTRPLEDGEAPPHQRAAARRPSMVDTCALFVEGVRA